MYGFLPKAKVRARPDSIPDPFEFIWRRSFECFLESTWTLQNQELTSKITSDTHWKCVKDKYPGLDLDTLLNYTDCAKELADEFKADTLFKSEKEVNSGTDYVKNIHNIRGNLHLFQVMIELHHLRKRLCFFLKTKNRFQAG